MKATWKLLTFLSIFLAFTNNLIAQRGQTLSLDNGKIKITSNGYKQGNNEEVAATGPYTITQNNPTQIIEIDNTITVSSDVTTEIILDGVNIKANNPFNAQNAGNVTLILKGENTIESTSGGPAVSCPVGEGASLTIKEEEGQVGSLKASVNRSENSRLCFSGIGFNADSKGSIIIESGKINAFGGECSAGIGQSGSVKGGTIIIKDGIIEARGGFRGTGIGGGIYGGNISITIKGGHIKAKTDYCAAGIGNAQESESSTISISGGYIEAIGGGNAAGIGGGLQDQGGIITISGGNISATGGDPSSSSGIGAGNNAKGQNITISGGVINAVGKNGGAGIGNSPTVGNTPSRFSTGDAGNAIIFATSISAESDKEHWSGLIFENKNGKIYGGNTYEVNQDVTIPVDHTLIIGAEESFSIAAGTTLTNKGTIVNRGATNFAVSTGNAVIRQYKLTKDMIAVEKAVYNGSQCKPEVTVERTPEPGVVGSEKYTVTYENNINVGVGTVTICMNDPEFDVDALFGEAIKNFTIAKADPTITFTVPIGEDLIYNGTAKEATASVSGVDGETEELTATLSYEKKAGNGTWNPLSSAPTDAGTYRAVATFEGTGNYKASTQNSGEFCIAKAPTTIAEITVPQKTYDGSAIVIIPPAVTGSTLSGQKATLSYFQGETQLESAPIHAGNYTVKAVYDGDENHEAATPVSQTFTITQATNSWTSELAIEGWTYGASAKNPSATAAFGTPTFNYAAAEDGEYTGTVPTTAGTWWVKASVAATSDYAALVSKTSFSITPADAGLSFAQTSLTMTQGNAVPANALTNPHTCAVTYTSSEPTVATVDPATGVVTVVGVGTTIITATAEGNYTGSASYTLTVNSYIPPYIPPTPDPDPVYYTVTIPTEVAGAIIHGGGTHEVEEYTYCSFRIELDPNGNGEYPTVTKGYWWDTLTPDGQGNYSVYVTGDTQITIGEVPTNSYDYYQVTLPTDSVAEADDQYWSGDYIEVVGASPLRAAEEASLSYQAPFGTTVTLRPIETERRKFLQWEDGSKQKERTLTLRDDQEVKALWQRISPTGIEAIAVGSVLRGERGQLYIEVPEACDVTLYTYGGVPVRVARLAAGANHLSNLNAGLYLVKLGGAQAVPVRIR